MFQICGTFDFSFVILFAIYQYLQDSSKVVSGGLDEVVKVCDLETARGNRLVV
jgi:hypothetical protein